MAFLHPEPVSLEAGSGWRQQEVGGDGFLIASNVNRRNIAEIVDGLSPALMRRGLIRSGYDHANFRDNLLAF